MKTFEEIRTEAIDGFTQTIETARENLNSLYRDSDNNSGLAKSWEPIMPEEPVCAVSRNDALNMFLDLMMANEATEEQAEYCKYLSVSIPGKNFCDASWMVESLLDLENPPSDFEMPPISASFLEDLTGLSIDPKDIVLDDDDDGMGGNGNEGPLVPADPNTPSSPSPEYAEQGV